jgi:hypothetical protein
MAASMGPQPWELRKLALLILDQQVLKCFNGAAALGAAETPSRFILQK